MTDFDNNFFEFENADTFLDSISGTLNNLSPSSVSGDESKFNNFSELDWSDSNNTYKNGTANQFIGIDNTFNDYANLNYMNPNINEVAATNEYSDYNGSKFQSSNMSTGTYSQDSGYTPVSHPSISSNNTSPEPISKKGKLESDEEDEKPRVQLKKNKVCKPKAKDKTSHNMIEKKYRTNINSKILTLRDAVPSLRIAAGRKDMSVADLEGLKPAAKLNKASVLTKATEYIKHLEAKNDMLSKQNRELQKLIQEANLNQNNQTNNIQPDSQLQPQTQNQLGSNGFGYYPSEQAYNSTPIQPSYSGSLVNYDQQAFTGNNFDQQQYSPQQPANNKYLLGGMAAVMTTSFFGGGNGNDIKGLSALPFAHLFPYSLTHPSPLTIQIWSFMKVLLIVISLAHLVLPILTQTKKEKSLPVNNVFKSWVLVRLGLQLPIQLSEQKRKEILSRLNGQTHPSWSDLVSDYFLLSVSDATFENCLLNLLIGKLVVNKYPYMAKVVQHNMSIKGSLVLNMEYKGEETALIKLNHLIGKVDGLSMLGSQPFITRLTNVINQKPINFAVNDGQNHIKYIEIFQENRSNIYEYIFEWRILELIHQLNMKYLEGLPTQDEEILSDLKLIESILETSKSTTVGRYFELFKSIIDSKYAPALLNSMKSEVWGYLENFRTVMEGQQLTDHEITSGEEEGEGEVEEELEEEVEEELEEEVEETEEIKLSDPTLKPISSTLLSKKSLISSLNLISNEEFIILTSSLIVYYFKKQEIAHSIKFLKYLNLKESKGLSILSFTSVVRMINDIIPGIEDNEELDGLVKYSREWLNEENLKNFMEFKLRSDLGKLIVEKGMILNGVDNVTDDE